ncbi:MAG TPA: KOW motif-containing protein [Chloroflexota bacterium]|jgi:transcription antitermination factor NusG|nr:KOW motif-containing protein [Chloroflexota bacterium]
MPSFMGGLRQGDRVRVIAGYFKGEEGVVQTADADGRAVVEIQQGEGSFKARFTASQIERAIAPPADQPADSVG